jgi:hypothetical protein
MKLRNWLIGAVILICPLLMAADYYTSTNMNLVIPIPGVATGPDWANDINASLTLIDTHDHSLGKGVPITPAGMNITGNLAFNDFFLTGWAGALFTVQNSDPSTSGAIYTKGVDLYYKDFNGNAIQITASGGVNGSPGSISNLTSPASASYVSANGTFVWQQGVSTAANMDEATLILRYPGSYPAPSGDYIAIQAPSSLATGYAFTLPAVLPSSNGALLTSSTAGAISYSSVDNSTLATSGGTLSVKALGIGTSQLANSAVTTGKIASGAVTSTQIASGTITGSNIGSSTVTNANLAAPNSVASSQVNFTTTSTSYVVATNSGLGITTTGKPLELILVATGGPGYLSTAAVNETVTLGVQEDGSGSIDWTQMQSSSTVGVPKWPLPGPLIIVPTAASHSFSILIHGSTGSTVGIQNVELYALEL